MRNERRAARERVFDDGWGARHGGRAHLMHAFGGPGRGGAFDPNRDPDFLEMFGGPRLRDAHPPGG